MEANAAITGLRERLSRVEQRQEDHDRLVTVQLETVGRDIKRVREQVGEVKADVASVRDKIDDENDRDAKERRLVFYAVVGPLVAALISGGAAVVAASVG